MGGIEACGKSGIAGNPATVYIRTTFRERYVERDDKAESEGVSMKAQETVQSAKGGSPHSREIQNEVGRIWSDVVRDKYLYVLALPGLIFYHFQIYSDYESRDCLPGVFSILWSARKPLGRIRAFHSVLLQR